MSTDLNTMLANVNTKINSINEVKNQIETWLTDAGETVGDNVGLSGLADMLWTVAVGVGGYEVITGTFTPAASTDKYTIIDRSDLQMLFLYDKAADTDTSTNNRLSAYIELPLGCGIYEYFTTYVYGRSGSYIYLPKVVKKYGMFKGTFTKNETGFYLKSSTTYEYVAICGGSS